MRQNYEEIWSKQWEELVPFEGTAGTMQGEILRAAAKLCRRWCNDGEWIILRGCRYDSAAENAWGFLRNAYTLFEDGEERDALKHISEIAMKTAESVEGTFQDSELGPILFSDEAKYQDALEHLLEEVTTYIARRPLIPTQIDYLDKTWQQKCVEELQLPPAE